jgi:hypothetical protein
MFGSEIFEDCSNFHRKRRQIEMGGGGRRVAVIEGAAQCAVCNVNICTRVGLGGPGLGRAWPASGPGGLGWGGGGPE